MAEPITYANAGGPPANWHGLRIFDLESGQEVTQVVEVNTVEGWLIRYKLNEEGRLYLDPENPEQAARERLTGRFEIRPPA
jgi:hypothetical protein